MALAAQCVVACEHVVNLVREPIKCYRVLATAHRVEGRTNPPTDQGVEHPPKHRATGSTASTALTCGSSPPLLSASGHSVGHYAHFPVGLTAPVWTRRDAGRLMP